MPKETKKFINPLLRPSQQEVEPKQEIPPKQEKSAATVQASKTSSTHQIVEQEEKSKPTDPPMQEAREPVNGSTTRPRPARSIKHVTEPEIADGQENGTPEQSNNHVQTYEPQTETLRPHPNQTLIRPETPPYNAHVSTVAESIVAKPEEKSLQATPDMDTDRDTNIDIEESDDDTYESEIDFTNVTTKARRKRGEQAFEKTHVRITVWIDKSLKQSFEDLAFQRDKPKTTLLDEAIADLVRKYEAH